MKRGIPMYQFDKNSLFLVTGGAGFIGSNLVEKILDLGYRVRVLDDLSNGKIENLKTFKDNKDFEFMMGDIRDYKTCLIATKDVDYVLHQAAWGSVPRSIEIPLVYEEINIKGTLNMMEAARVNKIKKFVYASSSSVYGDEANLPKIEGREGNLLSPYALTKKVNEYYGKLYKELYNLDTYGLRYFNVFGRRQNSESAYAAVVPKFIKQLINNEKPTIYGDGTQTRDFTYIDNVIDANLKACLASSDYAGDVFNIAYGGRESINEIYNHLTKALEINIKPIYGAVRPGDIKDSNANISKAKKNLKYDPKWDFKSGLKETIHWYTDNLK